jgi:dipeptidyl-peptidase-3
MSIRPLVLERVGPAVVVQLYADGFSELSLVEKQLTWHLYQAALAGRDIYYDQRYVHGLALRDLLEVVYEHRDRLAPDVAAAVETYLKLFWINSGPYEHLTSRKFVLGTTVERFTEALHALASLGIALPLDGCDSIDAFVERFGRDLFDAAWRPMVTSKNPGPGEDILTASANNLYEGVTLAEVDGFAEHYALNSRLVRDAEGDLHEEVYRVGGRYGETIRRIVSHLNDALAFAPPATQRALEALIRFYETGRDADRRAYDVAWVEDATSRVDTINGFVEVYLDARGHKGAWESLVCYENPHKTEAMRRIAAHARWFEDQMPYDAAYRRPDVVGVSARAIDVVVEAGDAGPMTAIGINLPNDETVRELYGSKSVSLSNVIEAYEQSQPRSLKAEFCWSADELARAEQWQGVASELATNLHEVIGHGSGRVAPHLEASPQSMLKEQYSSLEETRSDLIALYFIADPVMVQLDLVEAQTHEDVVLAEYEGYTRNALVQLRRVREGTHLEEDHMRNRQAIVHWLMAHTSAIERRTRDGHTYYVMVDAEAFRDGVARMLALVQRIKSEGLYDEARSLFDTYGVHFDPALRDEIVARVDALDLPTYTAFVMPRLSLEQDDEGVATDVIVSYPCDLATQMLEYSASYALAHEDRRALQTPSPVE